MCPVHNYYFQRLARDKTLDKNLVNLVFHALQTESPIIGTQQ